jgi:hypothetical protein
VPDPGFFIIHKWAEPPLKAGDYVLHAEHTVGGHAAQPLDSRIEVTSPRYALPPDQLLGVYPPANANGEFANRLPQIVIKRRTLPWERDADPDPAHPGTSRHPHHPWLALVVLRADECTLKTDVKVEDAVTAGVTLPGHRDVDQCTTVDVGESVVDAVFPTVDELPLLCHCREVDVRDTELAMGDDDGFLAVVLSNRLPMADVVTDADGNSVVQPVRYLACLVNLEHQFANLPQAEPPDRPPVFEFDSRALAVETMFVRPEGDPDHIAVQNANLDATVALQSATPLLLASSPAAAGGAGRAVAGGTSRPAAVAYTASDWQTSTRLVEEAATARVDAGARVRKAIVEEFAGPSLIRMPLERRFRFPVLAYWTFTTTGVGGFDAYMEGLDVGLLGTQPPPPKPAPAPKHGPPPSAPPAPPRPPLETVDTGHIGLPHVTRRGDHTRAWYRGPFVPRPTDRPGLDANGRYPLAHVSDQLRVMTPDGREDVSRAAAFEIGRLMALSQPSIVASLLRWRTEQFGAARARSIGQAALRPGFLAGSVLASDLGRLATHRLLDAIGDAPEKVIAPVRPVVDPGRPLRYVDEGAELGVLARGLGVDAALLDPDGRAASQRLVDLATATVRVGDLQGGVSAERLDTALRADVSRVAEDINRSRRAPGGPLSHLIDEEPQP